MRRVIKVIFKVAGFLLLGFLMLWLCISFYVNFNKKELLAAINSQLEGSINGSLKVGYMEPSLIKDFPAISISLRNVMLYDTMYYKHHHKLLEANNISVSLYPFSIFSGSPRIRNIHIKGGSVYLFTDSTGYSNANIFFSRKDVDTLKESALPRINHVFLDNIHFVYEHKTNKKLFDFKIYQLEGEVIYKNKDWKASLKVDMLVNAMDFYNPNGPFLKGKHISADLKADYQSDSQVLNMPLKEIKIEANDVAIGAKIYLGQQPVTYKVAIKAEGINFQQGRSMLSTHIQGKIGLIDLKSPLNIQVSISGKDQKRDEPAVYANWQVKENILTGQGSQIADCSFTGYFFNQVNPALPVGDKNSVIAMNNFSGTWEGIAFTADSVLIQNLISPILSGHFRSSFDLKKLNPVIDNKSFLIKKGQVTLDLRFKGGIKSNDTVEPFITGTVLLKGADVRYIPRNLDFTNTQAELNFAGKDLLIKNVRLQNGANVLNMDGSMEDLLHYYYTNPEKVLLSWHIRSKQINLDQYKSFLETRSDKGVSSNTVPKATQPKSVRRFSTQLDHILEQSDVRLLMDVGQISYQKFKATNITAAVNITQAGIELQKVSLLHSGGKLQLSGRIGQVGSLNPFTLNANVENVRVSDFFDAFGNFGQTTISDKNMEGTISLQTAVTGTLNHSGMLVPFSIKGSSAFELKNSALLHFGPLKNIGNYLFRRRDFSHIHIRDLKGHMEIDSDRIRIYPIKFTSDAINADVEGIYAFGQGTDINMDIPLRNPIDDGLSLDELLTEKKRNTGIVIHLNVSDRQNGKMRIRLISKSRNK